MFMMKKFIYSFLTLVLGLVLSGSGCHHDAIDDPNGVLICGTIWAKYNVGEPGFFATDDSPIVFYQWERYTGWSASGVSFPSGAAWNSTVSTESIWGGTHDPCPDGWQIPTNDQFATLSCFITGWDAARNGRIFADGANSICLPAVGMLNYNTGNLDHVGTGHYWMNNSEPSLRIASFGSSGDMSISGVMGNMADGYSIRCVKTPK